MGTRWTKIRLKGQGDQSNIAVENWRDVQAAGTGVGTPPFEVEAVFKNTWRSITGYSTPEPVVQYYKDPFGQVRLKGTAARDTAVGVLTPGEVFMTLPLGYRPPHDLRFACINNKNAEALTVPIVVQSNGDMSFRGDTVGVGTVGAFYLLNAVNAYTFDTHLSVDGIAFRADDL